MKRRNILSTALSFSIVFLAIIGACSAKGSNGASNDEKIAGNWTGESICQVKNSPCHDENVILRLSQPDGTGNLKIEADKIVDGKPDFMGELDCVYQKEAQTIRCEMPQGTWDFIISGDVMTGTLHLPDKTLYRKINLKKEP